MGTGYTRNDASNNIANGNVIDAADLDGEFDAIESAFGTSGHSHDGTSAEGGAITVVGPSQEFRGDGSSWYPKSDATYDLGKSTASFDVAYVESINLAGTGITASAAEINYTDGVTSAIQTQLNGKQAADANIVSDANYVRTDQNFTNADHTKLDGIETNATNTADPAITSNGTTPSLASGISAAEVRSLIGAGTSSSDNATHTGEVTGSAALTIADNVVDAGNLKVTGNGSTSEFLRSDGDGSFSWVTPTNTTYSVGDGGLTQKNFTSTLKTKLDGIATGATNVTNNNQITNGAGYLTSSSSLNSSNLSGALPAISGAALTGIEGVPTGVIVMWSGQTTAIPSGWALCNGSNGTPNLTDKFVMGAGTSNETTTGGANTRTLSTANIPSHTHSFSGTTNTTGSHGHSGSTASAGAHTHNVNDLGGLAYPGNSGHQQSQQGWGRTSNTATTSAGAHTHTLTIDSNGNHSHTISGTTGSTGSTTGFDNRPAYMALAYIMKT